MRAYRLAWKTRHPGLIDGSVLRPDLLCRLERKELYGIAIRCGCEDVELGDLFHVMSLRALEGRWMGGRLIVEGCERFVRLAADLRDGRLEVSGAAGILAGAGMRGGEIHVSGEAGPLAGAGMEGGLLVIDGDAGSELGGPLTEESSGMNGGEIIVHGGAHDRAGRRQRGGLIAVRGRVGAYAGLRMSAGTLVAGRGDLETPGVGMDRGTIIALESRVDPPPGFAEDGLTRPVFFRILFRRLLDLGFPLDEGAVGEPLLAFSGDRSTLGRGEILYRTGRRKAPADRA